MIGTHGHEVELSGERRHALALPCSWRWLHGKSSSSLSLPFEDRLHGILVPCLVTRRRWRGSSPKSSPSRSCWQLVIGVLAETLDGCCPWSVGSVGREPRSILFRRRGLVSSPMFPVVPVEPFGALASSWMSWRRWSGDTPGHGFHPMPTVPQVYCFAAFQSWNIPGVAGCFDALRVDAWSHASLE